MLTATLALFVVLGAAATGYANPLKRQSESHSVTLINNCGSGTPVFLYQANANPQGSTTIAGPLLGGVAWMSNYGNPACQSSGVNCDVVEFTLVNPGSSSGNTQNAIDYSLQSQGNHEYQYQMYAVYDNGCGANGPPGPCTGPTQAECPGAFVGSDTTDGTVYQCEASNIGITITFC